MTCDDVCTVNVWRLTLPSAVQLSVQRDGCNVGGENVTHATPVCMQLTAFSTLMLRCCEIMESSTCILLVVFLGDDQGCRDLRVLNTGEVRPLELIGRHYI